MSHVPYPPDCADCPTPGECISKNDCQVMRQMRHGHEGKYIDPWTKKKLKCPTCKSKGFDISILPGRCTFCDGTEGGNPPDPKETK